MERVFLKDVVSNIGNKVKVQGFVENIRDSKAMVFVVLKDITGKVQVTLEKEKAPNLAEKFSEVTPDSVITIVGDVIANEYVKMGGIEIIPTEVEIESIAQAIPIARKEIPATKKKKAVERSSIDQRIDYRWIDLRTDENQLMFKIQTTLVNAMREYLIKNNFIDVKRK